MSILIDQNSRVLVQGITGREGSFHTEQMLSYGTPVVGGVTPGKGGQTVHGVPVFDTVREAVDQTDANVSVLFVPPLYTRPGLMEALEAEAPLILTIAEHVPVHDMMQVMAYARSRNSRVIGPNSFGVISPGKGKAGFMAHRIFSEGPVAVMSRSATNCYETVFMMTNRGIGQSTCIGIGGDMIPGSPFVDFLPMLEADEQTQAIVMIGEIGGQDEERAAAYIKDHVSKPVIALIAGKNAPKERSMGHAGAIVSPDGAGSAENKEAALREAGAHIADSTMDVVEMCEKLL